jgi:hypothetical protein
VPRRSVCDLSRAQHDTCNPTPPSRAAAPNRVVTDLREPKATTTHTLFAFAFVLQVFMRLPKRKVSDAECTARRRRDAPPPARWLLRRRSHARNERLLSPPLQQRSHPRRSQTPRTTSDPRFVFKAGTGRAPFAKNHPEKSLPPTGVCVSRRERADGAVRGTRGVSGGLVFTCCVVREGYRLSNRARE